MPDSSCFLKTLVDPDDIQIDVVAVHGLNYTDRENHAKLTWTAPNNKMWLEDSEFLPSKLPNARILLFGYNANVAFRASTAGVDEQAGNLLNRLDMLRKKSESTDLPIMFICYSLGGIIAKRALVIAKNNSTYASICQSSFGLVFFGTPHQGGNFASLGKLTESIAGLPSGNTLIEALVKDSLIGDTMIKDFRHQLEDRYVVTFYETHPVGNIGIIVDQKSATIGLSGPREIQVALDVDHENLCVFENCDDFEQVGDNIQVLAWNAKTVASKVSSESKSRSTPRISTLPDLLYQHFTGREPQLRQLYEIIAKPGLRARRVSIYGMPGVGKSQLALKFADCNQLIYNTFFVQATDETQLLRDFNIIHSFLSLPKRSQDEQEVKVRDVIQWLINNQGDNGWLIIFDNVLDVNTTKKFLPPGGAGVVVFTMRSEEIAKELGLAGRLELLPMEESEGVELILKISELSDPQSSEYLESRKLASEIQQELGGLPLALAQGTTFSKHNRWSMNQYLDRLRGAEKIEILKKEALFGSDTALYLNSYSTFSIAIKDITPTAVMLLKLISHLDHQNVPFQLFKNGRSDLAGFLDSLSITSWLKRLEAHLRNDYRYKGSRSAVKGYACDESIKLMRKLFFVGGELEKAVSRIQCSALIRRNAEGDIWMHDLFREFSQHFVDPSERKFIAASAIVLARGAFSDVNRKIDTNMEDVTASHLAKSIKNAQEVELLMVSYTSFFLGDHYHRRGLYLESVEWYQRALAGYEKAQAKGHPSTLDTINNMAAAFSRQGKEEKALEWFQRALAGREKALGNKHPDTLNTISNMAVLFNNQGKYEKALEWHQRALDGREKALGKEHPDTLCTTGNMATVFSKQGKYEKALEWYQRALAGLEKALGKEHPDTLHTINNMATLFSKQGKCEKALEWYQRALDGRKKTLENEHPDTLTTINNMALEFSNQGKYEKALEWYQRALSGREKALGNEHPDTLTTINNMALAFDNQGKYEKALEWYQRALAGLEKALGNEHPDTLDTIDDMATVFGEQGKGEKALELYQRALDGREKVLGKEHPSTLHTINNMATVFSEQGKEEKALEWYQRALDGREKALGKEHPDTLCTTGNMATVFSKQGKYEKALEWYQRALAGLEKALGNEHPNTLTTINNMALAFSNQGKYEKALEWYQRALAGREKALGNEHPHTLDTIDKMATLFSNQGKEEKAMGWHQRALAGREKALGKKHPDTLHTVSNVATLFSKQGKYEKALEWYQRALDGREKALGKEHPATLHTIDGMAMVFSKEEKEEKALKLYQRALAGREKALGKEHPDTLHTINDMATVFSNQGKEEKALEWYQRALDGREKVLGREHHLTLQSARCVEKLHTQRGHHEEAAAISQKFNLRPPSPPAS